MYMYVTIFEVLKNFRKNQGCTGVVMYKWYDGNASNIVPMYEILRKIKNK